MSHYNRDYSKTADSKPVDGYCSISLKAEEYGVTVKTEAGKEKRREFSGFLDVIRVEQDQGNADYKIKPHKKLVLTLTRMEGDELKTFKMYIPSYQTKVSMSILNALFGELDRPDGNWDGFIKVRPYQKDNYIRLHVETFPGELPNRRWQFNEDTKTFGDCPPLENIAKKGDPIWDSTEMEKWLELRMDELANEFGRFLSHSSQQTAVAPVRTKITNDVSNSDFDVPLPDVPKAPDFIVKWTTRLEETAKEAKSFEEFCSIAEKAYQAGISNGMTQKDIDWSLDIWLNERFPDKSALGHFKSGKFTEPDPNDLPF